MNLFYLDDKPEIAAEYHCNKHVVKMILEAGQMLCAAHWLHLLAHYYEGDVSDFKRVKDLKAWLEDDRNTHPLERPPWGLTHMRHPCTVWTNESLDNYVWHWRLGVALCREYTERYGRVHKAQNVFDWLGKNHPRFMKSKGITPLPICMKEEYKVGNDTVASYRNYYIKDKVRFAVWEPRAKEPDWFKQLLEENMPEGPEVKITTDFLKEFESQKIKSISILSGRYAKKGGIENLEHVSFPALLEEVNCKGKFIYFKIKDAVTDRRMYLFSTLGMTGMWSKNKTKHSRVCLSLENSNDTLGVTDVKVYYNDIRNFGTLKFVTDKKDLDKKLNSLGPDVLTKTFNQKEMKQRFLKKSEKTVVEVLMDQSVISGVGHYLKCEILYASHISPHRKCKDITDKEFKVLYDACYWLPKVSYKLGGSTLYTYKQPDGREGLYNRRFAVYNQDADTEGRKVLRETTLDKRTTHWVPEVQK